jgi:hypothetical protein
MEGLYEQIQDYIDKNWERILQDKIRDNPEYAKELLAEIESENKSKEETDDV